MERPMIHGQTRKMNLNPPSSWQEFNNCFLDVMSEWIGVRMEQKFGWSTSETDEYMGFGMEFYLFWFQLKQTFN